MRRVWKAIGIVAVALVAFALGVSAWLYFYIADLPPVSELATFNPAAESEAQVRSCDGSKWLIHVVPTQRLGSYTIAAVTAAEGQPDPRSPYVALFSPAKKSVVGYEVQLARTLACTKQRHLSRELEELRIANDINRKFKQPELLTIYLNRVYFGTGAYGVEAAARKYFAKSASSLTLEEAALLVGLIKSPNYYSPQSHRERALERRNVVLDEMVAQGSVSRIDAALAKAKPVQVLE